MIGSDRFSWGGVRTAVIASAVAASILCFAGSPFADNYIFTDRNADAYVLTKNYVSYSTNATGDDILTLNDLFGGNYLWVRRTGKEFVIRDAHAIKDARRLFAPLDEVEPERAALQQTRQHLETEESSLDAEKAGLDDRVKSMDSDDKSSGARTSLERQLADLSARRIELEIRTSDLALREEALATRVRSLQSQIETSLWAFVDGALANGLGEVASRW
jgi:hypothetical protein